MREAGPVDGKGYNPPGLTWKDSKVDRPAPPFPFCVHTDLKLHPRL